jgi:putative transposase
MSRPLRIQFPGAVYHVMNRGAARQLTFVNDEDYEALLNTLAQAHQVWGIEVFSYALMKNHYHLCLRTPNGNLSRVMRHVDGLYTQRFNRSHNRDGALFRGRYKAILVDADEYLAQVVRYIHLNPIETGVVKQPEEYRWSSHRQYLQAKAAPEWLNTEEILEYVGGKKTFHEFVLSGNEEALEKFYKAKHQSPVLGSAEFVEKVRRPEVKLDKEIPRYQRRGVQASAEQVINRVAVMYAIRKEAVLKGVRGKENEARKLAMYLVRRCCDQTLSETARVFGLGSYGAVGWGCNAIQTRMEKEQKFRHRMESLVANICQQKI